MVDMVSVAGWLNLLNPFQYISHGEYINWWSGMVRTLLSGFWSRFFASTFLLLAFWLVVYRRRFALGILLFFMSVTIAYLGSLVSTMFWWSE